jgi:hypothetical protein
MTLASPFSPDESRLVKGNILAGNVNGTGDTAFLAAPALIKRAASAWPMAQPAGIE